MADDLQARLRTLPDDVLDWSEIGEAADRIDALEAVVAKVKAYADERAWYGSRNRTVGSQRIASDLLAILDGVQGAAEPWTDPEPWVTTNGQRRAEHSNDGYDALLPRTREQYDAEEGNRG